MTDAAHAHAAAAAPLPPFLRDTPEDLARAAALLQAGEIVALPTETVYGLAANALDEAAVRKIFAAKGRPLIDPLIVHAATLEDVAQLAEIPPALAVLAAHFWPGPLTVVLCKKAVVPGLVTAGNPTVAVRIPAHPLMRKVIELSGRFLAGPSANPFGYVSPTCAAHVRDSLGPRAPWILDGGNCEHGVESTILDLATPGAPRLLRPGPISREEIEAALGVAVASGTGQSGGSFQLPASGTDVSDVVETAVPVIETKPQLAPGMLSRHYSPRTPVLLRAPGTAPALRPGLAARQAVVWLRRPETAAPQPLPPTLPQPPQSPQSPLLPSTNPAPDVFWLSEDGDLREVARNIFALLRRLDAAANYALIHVESADGIGLATAINDRLRRAAAQPAPPPPPPVAPPPAVSAAEVWEGYYASEPQQEAEEEAWLAPWLAPAPAAVVRRALDLGCGPGHATTRLLNAGYEVTAIDYSTNALARARLRNPAARHIQADLRDLARLLPGLANTSSAAATTAAATAAAATAAPAATDTAAPAAAAWNAVVAGLSLHYFTKNETQEIFDAIHAALFPGALFAFRVNAADHRGAPLDSATWRLVTETEDGVPRQYFTEEKIHALLAGRFDILSLQKQSILYKAREKSLYEVILRKK
jgi:L-threonylcarbamoyladenylate synthase